MLTGRASGGAIVTAVLSDQAPDANEVDIIGRDGRLRFSLYRGDSLEVTSREPDYRARARARALGHRAAALPTAIRAARTGGDFVNSYAAQLERVVAAIRGDGRPGGDLGRRPPGSSHRRSSGRRGRRPAAARRSNADVSTDAPALTVVLAGLADAAALETTLLHLRAQTVRENTEVIVVTPSVERLGALPVTMDEMHSCRVIEVPSATTVARPTPPALARPLRRSSPSQRITRTSTRSGARPSSTHTKANGPLSDPRSGTRTRPR